MRSLIQTIRERPDAYAQAAKEKGVAIDIPAVLKLDEERRSVLLRVEGARNDRNTLSKDIGAEEESSKRSEAITKMREAKERLKHDEDTLTKIEQQLNALLLLVPNLPDPQAPRGFGDEANVEIKRWGTPPTFAFPMKDHLTLGRALDLIDTKIGAAVSGFRGYYLKNEAVRIQQGLLQLALERIQGEGFTLMWPPTIVKERALVGSGHFPTGQEEIYRIVSARHYGEEEDDPQFLVGTAEPSLLAYYADAKFSESDLPILLCGISPCYRSEAGSYGRDTKGLYRLHEFMKVEQVVLCKNSVEESTRWFQKMLSISEGLLQDLELPYRAMNIATGEMGVGKYRMVDLETWMPSRNAYGETHSNSLLTDWQAQRLNIRYTDQNGKMQYVHTLNNTGLASPRLLIPLLECHQEEDGSVKIPKALQPYVGTRVIKRKV